MKTARVLRWVVMASVGTLAACGGISDIGSGDDPGTGGTDGMGAAGRGKEPNGRGAVSMGASSGKDPGTGMPIGGKDPGKPDPGTGTPILCMSDAECQGKAPDALCQMCADGSVACQKSIC